MSQNVHLPSRSERNRPLVAVGGIVFAVLGAVQLLGDRDLRHGHRIDQPGHQHYRDRHFVPRSGNNPDTFNQLFTMHGTTMIFLVVWCSTSCSC